MCLLNTTNSLFSFTVLSSHMYIEYYKQFIFFYCVFLWHLHWILQTVYFLLLCLHWNFHWILQTIGFVLLFFTLTCSLNTANSLFCFNVFSLICLFLNAIVWKWILAYIGIIVFKYHIFDWSVWYKRSEFYVLIKSIKFNNISKI